VVALVLLLLDVVVRVDPLPLVCFLFAALPNEALAHDCISFLFDLSAFRCKRFYYIK
jgi:hypothetical protein